MDNKEFEGLPVAVIGGALGVGPAVVEAFAGQGARVVVGTYGDGAAPEAGAAVAVDLADAASINRSLDRCEAAAGPLAVVVMVPPPVRTAEVMSISEDEFRRVADAELLGPVLCLREAARRMIPRGYGRLISFSSMSGKTGAHPHVAPYAAAKGGLIAFTRSLAAEIAPTGVTCNVIATALFDVQVAGIQDLAPILKGIPVGRVGRSREAAHAALFLASRDAGYVTGETLNLSGGRFMD